MKSVMIEVRRDLYLDEVTGEFLPSAEKVRHRLVSAIRRAIEFT